MARSIPSARPAPLAALAAALSAACLGGCLLAEEDCGLGFVFEDDRCVPAETPPPFRASDGGPAVDARPLLEIGVLPAPEPEPDPGQPDDWAEFRIALLVDRTPRASAGRTPSSPGADIDALQAVEAGPRGDMRIGVGGEVLGALFNDPFEGSLNTDPDAVLGEPDGRVASLGPDGGFVYIGLALGRPLRRGDLLVVVERLEPGGDDDGYALYACRTPSSLDDCRALGEGAPGITRFVLE